MKTVAYLRVSTAQQDAGSQRLAILEYARRQGFRIDDFIEATASARTSAKHQRLDQLREDEIRRGSLETLLVAGRVKSTSHEPVNGYERLA